jgi:hypothetical protein
VTKEYIISSGLLELYATGATTEDETAQVLQAFINWPEVKDDVQDMEKTMEAYAVINGVNVSDDVKNKLFKTLQLSNPVSVSSTTPVSTTATKKEAPVVYMNVPLITNIAAAAVALLFISATFNLIFYNKYRAATIDLDASTQQIATLKNTTSETVSEMKIVQSKYSLPLKLKPDVAPKDADAKIYWLTNTGEIYIDPTNLPDAPKGKQYQLWAIVDGKAIDGGLIVPNKDKKLSFQKMKTFGKAQAFAVTLEVEGGVVTSKEKPYVIVSL